MVPPRRTLLPLALAAALGACGGGGARYADDPGPAGSIPVGAAITDRAVNISPDHLGAGLVKLVVTNLTQRSQQLIVRSAANGSFQQETAPINPQDTAQLKADLGPGSYTVSVADARVRAANLAVGARRPPAVNELP